MRSMAIVEDGRTGSVIGGKAIVGHISIAHTGAMRRPCLDWTTQTGFSSWPGFSFVLIRAWLQLRPHPRLAPAAQPAEESLARGEMYGLHTQAPRGSSRGCQHRLPSAAPCALRYNSWMRCRVFAVVIIINALRSETCQLHMTCPGSSHGRVETCLSGSIDRRVL